MLMRSAAARGGRARRTPGQHGQVRAAGRPGRRQSLSAASRASSVGLEREGGRDRADHVVEGGRHRARRHERQERERQGEHEGEQRGRAHLARERADRQPERGERERRRPRARRARAGSGPSRAPRTGRARPASAGRPRTEQTAARPAFSSSSAGARHEPAHEPREGVLLALERERAGRQQQRDEHQRDRHRERHRERAERGGAALERASPSPGSARPPRPARRPRRRGSRAPARANSITWSTSLALAASRAAARCAPRAGSRSERSRPEHVEVLAQEACSSPPVLISSSSCERLLGDALRERGVRRLHLRLDRVLHELALGRVLGVVVDLHRAGLERRTGASRRGRPGSSARRAPRRRAPSGSPPRGCPRAPGRSRRRAAAPPREVDPLAAQLDHRPTGPRARCRTPPPACPGPRESAKPISTAITIG